MDGLFQEAGFWWPRQARNKTSRYLKHWKDAEGAIKLCRHRRVVVQAGGNMGLWPHYLARKFARVITFEPDAANLECLRRNCRNRKNIEVHQALLGARSGSGRLLFNSGNAGGHKCTYDDAGVHPAMADVLAKHGKYSASEDPMPVMAIDDLGLEGVDLIALDIEGAELPAFMGAARTICRCRPVIIYEERGHGAVHGYSDDDARRWLRKAGYRHQGKVAKDQLWIPTDG